MRGRFSKKLKPDEKMAPSLSIHEIHRRSSRNLHQLVEPCEQNNPHSEQAD